MLYDGKHRAEHAACLIESLNVPHFTRALRMERGRWRQRMILKLVFEDLPSERNYVKIFRRHIKLWNPIVLNLSRDTSVIFTNVINVTWFSKFGIVMFDSVTTYNSFIHNIRGLIV